MTVGSMLINRLQSSSNIMSDQNGLLVAGAVISNTVNFPMVITCKYPIYSNKIIKYMSMHDLDYTKKIDKNYALEIPFGLFCKLGNEVGRNIDQ